MLFIQSIDTYYEKQRRSSEYARLRTGDLFRKTDLSKLKECEVFAHLLSLRYDTDSGVSQAKPYSEKYKQYGKSIFTEGTRRDTLNETAFVLGKNEYGRIIYNNRYVDPDSSWWYYGWHIYNIINCDMSECNEKMFFKKNPNYEYRQLLDLR